MVGAHQPPWVSVSLSLHRAPQLETVHQYEKLKRRLADRFRDDRQAYNQAKTDFYTVN
jgi:GrpB-like predicted nucleotidyltransferase (UPF0157 family)